MSLKDEIGKLMSAQRALREQQEAKEAEFDELQKARFLPLRAVLAQVIKDVDSAYLRVQFTDHTASVEVGKEWDDRFEFPIRWLIGPKSTPRLEGEAGGAMFEAQPGFSVEEVETYHLPEFRQIQHVYTFESEGEVVQHILKGMAKWIAHYQHLEESERKRNSKDRP